MGKWSQEAKDRFRKKLAARRQDTPVEGEITAGGVISVPVNILVDRIRTICSPKEIMDIIHSLTA